jgi:hypothetical protein
MPNNCNLQYIFTYILLELPYNVKLKTQVVTTEFRRVLSGIRAAQSSVFCVFFCRRFEDCLNIDRPRYIHSKFCMWRRELDYSILFTWR